MADLSFLQRLPGTVDAIDRAYEAQRQPRGYLGLSQAGHECPRFLWYAHRGETGKQPEGRILRLFYLGEIVESMVIADLAAAGCEVTDCQREVEFTQGKIKLRGHIDGIVKGLAESPETPHLFECKSASKKKFEELLKLGSYKLWNEIYYWQVQLYVFGLHLKRAAVFVYCKDDSQLYMERIRLDKEATEERLRRIFEAITSPIEPERACPRADNYKAKFCPYHEVCFVPRKAPSPENWLW